MTLATLHIYPLALVQRGIGGFFQFSRLVGALFFLLLVFSVAAVLGAEAEALSRDDQAPSETLASEEDPRLQMGLGADKDQLLTVAVVVMPRQADGSKWDVGFGADLVLCGVRGCYVSQGLETPAVFYPGGSGLRLLKKAGACRDRLKCVFRGVDVGKLVTKSDSLVQIVDVDYLSHQYLSKFDLRARFQCRADGALLSCQAGVHQRSFSLWAITEAVAGQAGRAGLDHALFKGLMHQRPAALLADLKGLRVDIKTSVRAFYKLTAAVDVPPRCLERPAFLTETFYVLGLADAKERRAEALIRDFVGQRPVAQLRGIVESSPQLYWAFRDLVRQLNAFSLAKTSVYDKDSSELRLIKNGGDDQLIFGWHVAARGRALLQSCGVLVPEYQ